MENKISSAPRSGQSSNNPLHIKPMKIKEKVFRKRNSSSKKGRAQHRSQQLKGAVPIHSLTCFFLPKKNKFHFHWFSEQNYFSIFFIWFVLIFRTKLFLRNVYLQKISSENQCKSKMFFFRFFLLYFALISLINFW